MTDSTTTQENTSPELWNPNAAASWCLLFSPAFGSYLHTKNWEAMGEPDKAASSLRWFYVSIGMITLYVLMGIIWPENPTADGFTRLLGFGYLLSWYFASAKKQAAYVKEKYGETYVRRPWGKVLLMTLGIFVALIIAVAILSIFVALLTGHSSSSASGM